jgi:UDP-N-acetylglucosamine--N-acetylmuramyl-(pentapeptide) pyrophosphoryl-undecaprenol N-acetylglucosamine transferase
MPSAVSPPTILVAGGGTGGHVFPAVAVAERLHARAEVRVVFCGTPRGLEVRIVPERGWPLELLDAEPLVGGGVARALRGGVQAARTVSRALPLVRRLEPKAALSVGGYAAGPVVLAAALLGVPVAVLEPNHIPGVANRLLAPVARRAYVASGEAARIFRPEARRLFGVPIRAGFSARAYIPNDPPRILVLGGSQGAAALNEKVPGAVARALRGDPAAVVHQVGRGREASVRRAYASAGLPEAHVVGFIDDVARAIADADVVVARAGAGTLAEISAIGRASILVPFPHAAHDHQAKNAEALAHAGAAAWIRQDASDPPWDERLAVELGRLLRDTAVRSALASAARALGRPTAADRTAADLLELAGIGSGADPGRPLAIAEGRARPRLAFQGAT